MMVARLNLQEAKDRLLIPELWQRLGLPGDCTRQPCRSPLRDGDRNPSLSIYDGGRRWKDHGGGGQGGDAIDFLAAATGVDIKEATRRFLALAGGDTPAGDSTVAPQRQLPPRSVDHASGKPIMPADLHQGTAHELQRLAQLRSLSVEGIKLANHRGLLRFGRVCQKTSWIVLDATRQVAQARRLDGHSYPAFETVAERKAHTLRGSRPSWPVGAREAAEYPYTVLVEGGGDFLAAHHLFVLEDRSDVAAVGVLGGANYLHRDALTWLSGKIVRIYPHLDEAGAASAQRWTKQLLDVGCVVDAFSFEGLQQTDGSPVLDLNDLARIDADSFEAEREHLEEILPR